MVSIAGLSMLGVGIIHCSFDLKKRILFVVFKRSLEKIYGRINCPVAALTAVTIRFLFKGLMQG
jgi:hypothetical protein